MDGFLNLDKPGGMTSRDAVNVVQRWLPRRTKLGHTGTLVPLATGVLVLCIGKATKLAERIQAMPKQYKTRVLLGATSDTDDADGTITTIDDSVSVELAAIEAILPRFIGVIQQQPPAYSAIKVNGRRSYDLARKNNAVELQARPVRVDAIRIDHYEWPNLDLTIDCGKGTYIRSIARDLGTALGVGGLVQTLRRTRVGPFQVEQAASLSASPEAVLSRLVPITELPL